jgi:hypothetical protein
LRFFHFGAAYNVHNQGQREVAMKRFFRFVGSLAVIGTLVSAVVYFLHKKGILRVAVNYDDKEGQPVTRELDDIVETAVGQASEKVSGKVQSVATDVKHRIEQQLGIVKGQLGSSITVPTGGRNEFE